MLAMRAQTTWRPLLCVSAQAVALVPFSLRLDWVHTSVALPCVILSAPCLFRFLRSVVLSASLRTPVCVLPFAAHLFLYLLAITPLFCVVLSAETIEVNAVLSSTVGCTSVVFVRRVPSSLVSGI